MIPKDCKRLAEVDLPVAEMSQPVAEDRPHCFRLCVVTGCDNALRLQEPIRDPARIDWNEVTNLAHYYLEVNAMTQPVQVCEDIQPYGGKS